MPQIDPKDLDYSPEMVSFFEEVIQILRSHDIPFDQAKMMVDRFFSLDVTPLERALAMHRGAEQVAEDLMKPTV
jgi:hypothetical protein